MATGMSNYKISKGKNNSALVEFKLASNSGIRRNLVNQVKVYERANKPIGSIKVIIFFDEKEQEKF